MGTLPGMIGWWTIAAAEVPPVWQQLLRALSLQDYNTRVVLLGTLLLGTACGVLGVYMLLRRRALMGDAISHAALPGVVLAFMASGDIGGEKSLLWLLVGATISGGLGGATVLALRNWARIREDAALGIVLSVYFGAGIALLKIAQSMPGANAAGLEAFIYGKAALMTADDVRLIGGVAVVVLLLVAALGKELKLLCFDAELARSQGWPVGLLDGLLLAVVVLTTMVGLQAVGLILIIALLIVPAASARFWTHDLRTMVWISGALGAVSCSAGTLWSASVDKMPGGAAIVLVACAIFGFSFCVGTQRGVVRRWLRHTAHRIAFDEQHLLRATFEMLEAEGQLPEHLQRLSQVSPLPLRAVARRRGWSLVWCWWIARRLQTRGLIVIEPGGLVALTPRGLIAATRIVRNHRLLEIYLMDAAAARVEAADREADYLEHGLQPEHLAELSGELVTPEVAPVPPSPHELGEESDKA